MAVVDRINLLDAENILGIKTLSTAKDKDLVNVAPGINKIITATAGDLEKGVDKILRAPSTPGIEKTIGAVTGGVLDSDTTGKVGGVIGAIDTNGTIDKFLHGYESATSAIKQLGANCLNDLLGKFNCNDSKSTFGNGRYANANKCNIDAMGDLLSKFNNNYNPKSRDSCASSQLLKGVVGKAVGMGFSEVYSNIAGAFDPMDAVKAGSDLLKDSGTYDLMKDVGITSYAGYIASAINNPVGTLAKVIKKPVDVLQSEFDTDVLESFDTYDGEWDMNPSGTTSLAKIGDSISDTLKTVLGNTSKSTVVNVNGLLNNPTSSTSHWASSSASNLFSVV